MEIIKQLQQGTLDVTLVGKFTFNDHLAFREILAAMEEKSLNGVVLRMDRLDFVDSAALGMLLLALDSAGTHQKQLNIIGATGQVKKMFDLARFHTLFDIA